MVNVGAAIGAVGSPSSEDRQNVIGPNGAVAIDVTGAWCEIDTQRDLAVAEKMVAAGKLVHANQGWAA